VRKRTKKCPRREFNFRKKLHGLTSFPI
jgi:hypothetical protein